MRDEILKEKCELFSEPILRGYVLQKKGEDTELIDDRKFLLIEEHLKNCKFCSFCVEKIEDVLNIEKVDVDRREVDRSRTKLLSKISDIASVVSTKSKLIKVFSFFTTTTGFLTFISIAIILLILPLFFFKPFKGEKMQGNVSTLIAENSYGKKSGIVAISPSGTIRLEDVILFKWYPVFDAEKYKLKIFDENGNILFSTSTTKPEYSLKDNISFIFMSGKKYFWKVYALNSDDEVVEESKKILISPER